MYLPYCLVLCAALDFGMALPLRPDDTHATLAARVRGGVRRLNIFPSWSACFTCSCTTSILTVVQLVGPECLLCLVQQLQRDQLPCTCI